MADEKQTSALIRRHEQLKRWKESETNKQSHLPQEISKKVKFQDGCIFLAACSSGDRDEVKKFLERGADINTSNIDGLTALHQACIDDNLDMVEFLVDHGADVDVCDNEGWTPLHATASCGFTEIARYLLSTGANVAAVNNDGDLPIDICEEDEMERLLQDEMNRLGVDADAAREEEEEMMLADANHWLSNADSTDKNHKHPKTGATALHVAAAKGYVKVMNVLLQADVDINAKDFDGWTPLHAAAHWGQEEACKVLADAMCDMEAKNNAGQTCFDVADTDMIKLLEELKQKLKSHKDRQDLHQDLIMGRGLPQRRRTDSQRSSVTRMSVDQKQNVVTKTVEQERATLEANLLKKTGVVEDKSKSSSSSGSDDESSESETEKQNEINKQTSITNQPRERDKPPLNVTVEIKKPDMPKIDEVFESSNQVSNGGNNQKKTEETGNKDAHKNEIVGDGVHVQNEEQKPETDLEIAKELKKQEEKMKEKEKEKELKEKEQKENEQREREQRDKEQKEKLEREWQKEKLENERKEKLEKERKEKLEKMEKELLEKEKKEKLAKEKELKAKLEKEQKEKEKLEKEAEAKRESKSNLRDKDPVSRTTSAPGRLASSEQVPKISLTTPTIMEEGGLGLPSWRSGLRKIPSTSMVHESINQDYEVDKSLPRSASSPRLAPDSRNEQQERPRRPYSTTSATTIPADSNDIQTNDKFGSQHSRISNPYPNLSSYSSSSSSYQRAYVPYYSRQQEQNERREREKEKGTEISNSVANSVRVTVPSAASTTTTTAATSTYNTASINTGSTTIPTTFPYYRRSAYEPPKRDEDTETQRKARAKRARETRRSTQGVTLEEIQKAQEVLNQATDTNKETEKDIAAIEREKRLQEREKEREKQNEKLNENKDRLGVSSLENNKKDNSIEEISVPLRRTRDRGGDDRKEDETRSSYRRQRDRDQLSSSASNIYDSSYIPRARNALSTSDISGSTSPNIGTSVTRSTSLRSRQRNGEVENKSEDAKDETDSRKEHKDKEDRREDRKQSSAIRARRKREERRSTGVVDYKPENDDDEKDKENKDETKDEKKETDENKNPGSRYSSRYSDIIPSHSTDRYARISDRPSSYGEISHSTPSLDSDYKKLYEHEKTEKERLKKELEQCKKELKDAKVELDRLMKRSEAAKVADTNEKRERRALERKLSELEEEVKRMEQIKADNQRLRDENGALIRVISKLSK